MSEYGYMKHLFWNYRLYFIQIDFGFVSCYVICFSSIFLDLKYFQFNITVCLISFEYKRTAVKFSSGHYLSVFCSFLWVLPSLYGTLHSPIVWNLKPNQLCIISQFTGLLRKLPWKPCYHDAVERTDEDWSAGCDLAQGLQSHKTSENGVQRPAGTPSFLFKALKPKQALNRLFPCHHLLSKRWLFIKHLRYVGVCVLEL